MSLFTFSMYSSMCSTISNRNFLSHETEFKQKKIRNSSRKPKFLSEFLLNYFTVINYQMSLFTFSIYSSMCSTISNWSFVHETEFKQEKTRNSSRKPKFLSQFLLNYFTLINYQMSLFTFSMKKDISIYSSMCSTISNRNFVHETEFKQKKKHNSSRKPKFSQKFLLNYFTVIRLPNVFTSLSPCTVQCVLRFPIGVLSMKLNLNRKKHVILLENQSFLTVFTQLFHCNQLPNVH